MPNYSYFQTQQSNETSQTYFLERTQSARLTLEKAMRILPQNIDPSHIESSTQISEEKTLKNEVLLKVFYTSEIESHLISFCFIKIIFFKFI